MVLNVSNDKILSNWNEARMQLQMTRRRRTTQISLFIGESAASHGRPLTLYMHCHKPASSSAAEICHCHDIIVITVIITSILPSQVLCMIISPY